MIKWVNNLSEYITNYLVNKNSHDMSGYGDLRRDLRSIKEELRTSIPPTMVTEAERKQEQEEHRSVL